MLIVRTFILFNNNQSHCRVLENPKRARLKSLLKVDFTGSCEEWPRSFFLLSEWSRQREQAEAVCARHTSSAPVTAVLTQQVPTRALQRARSHLSTHASRCDDLWPHLQTFHCRASCLAPPAWHLLCWCIQVPPHSCGHTKRQSVNGPEMHPLRFNYSFSMSLNHSNPACTSAQRTCAPATGRCNLTF